MFVSVHEADEGEDRAGHGERGTAGDVRSRDLGQDEKSGVKNILVQCPRIMEILRIFINKFLKKVLDI